MKKLTVTFPDGTKGTRRTPRPYTHVIASRLDAPRRPDHDVVKVKYTRCLEHETLRASYTDRWEAINAPRRASEARIPALEAAWTALYNETDAAYRAHSAACPDKCDTSGNIRHEISRTPEPTGWRPVSWHHSLDLALKAMNTRTTAYATEGHDEVRIFPVDPEGGK